MIPTPKLRFVESRVYVNKPARNAYGQEGTVSELVKKTILQQWWENQMTINLGWTGDMPLRKAEGEWRDVPIEEEQA